MRDIKFRAFDNLDKRLVYGWLVDENAIYFDGDYYEIDPSTVGQYTGLKDKNGIEIYEGDIVAVFLEDRNENSYKRKSKIVYDDDSACFVLDDVNPQENFGFIKQTPTAYGPVVYYVEAEYELEVVGNIHDNPELLGDSK